MYPRFSCCECALHWRRTGHSRQVQSTQSSLAGTNPKDEPITSGLPVIRTSGTDTVHYSSKVSDHCASQRICLSLWLCGGFHFFKLFATPPGTVPSNFRMSPFFPTTQPRCASAKPIVLVSSSFICSQFFPRSIE